MIDFIIDYPWKCKCWFILWKIYCVTKPKWFSIFKTRAVRISRRGGVLRSEWRRYEIAYFLSFWHLYKQMGNFSILTHYLTVRLTGSIFQSLAACPAPLIAKVSALFSRMKIWPKIGLFQKKLYISLLESKKAELLPWAALKFC